MIILASLLAAIVPMVSYAIFIWWLDRYEREPIRLIILNFIWGAFGAILLTFALHGTFSALFNILLSGTIPETDLIDTVIVAPFVEEIAKGVFILFMLMSKEFDNITDGAVYGGTIGLGFGLTENFMYFISYGTDTGSWLQLVIIRSLFSAVMHSMATAIFGASVGYVKFSGKRGKIIIPLMGLFTAMLMHATWNGLVSFVETSFIGLFFIVLSIIIIFFLFQISLLIESRLIKRELEEEAELGIISEQIAKVVPFTSKRNKRGWIDEQKRKKVIAFATDLAFRKAEWKNITSSAKRERYEKDIIALRTELMKLELY